jgi:putative membrane protein insertion efficiency factor
MIKRFVILSIYGYRRLISPLIPPRCRFDPTCSRYAIHAIEHHGLRRGGWMAIKRVMRCHPFRKEWGYDPVPTEIAENLAKKHAKTAQPSSYIRSSIN